MEKIVHRFSKRILENKGAENQKFSAPVQKSLVLL